MAMQEKLVALPGFHFKWSLAMMEAVGVLLGSSLERLYEGSWNSKRVAPFRNYVLLAGLLGMSSSLSNIALNFIKYPTKVCDTIITPSRMQYEYLVGVFMTEI